jgi:glycine/D-amino acid oxidase-like deaminating enzyme
MIVIVGGGIMGACTALFLAEAGQAVMVLERDPSYATASTTLSAASIRTQFSLPLNVLMSRFGAAFFAPIHAEIGFHGGGYLVLARDRAALAANHAMQTALGAEIEFMDQPVLAARCPWLRTDDLAAGCWGRAEEGWFDAAALLRYVIGRAKQAGAVFRRAEVVDFIRARGHVSAVRLADGGVVAGDIVVIAAGALAGRLAAKLDVALPVVPRKRTVFVLRAPLSGRGMPLLFDPAGAWIRPEGEGFIAGIAPEQDPDADGDFEPDLDLLQDRLWPVLAHRIPAFEQLRRMRAWAGHYEVNTLDHNGVVGALPGYDNLYVGAGFSGHGVQHAPATGRGLSELITTGGYQSLDLTPLGYARIAANAPMPELEVY